MQCMHDDHWHLVVGTMCIRCDIFGCNDRLTVCESRVDGGCVQERGCGMLTQITIHEDKSNSTSVFKKNIELRINGANKSRDPILCAHSKNFIL